MAYPEVRFLTAPKLVVAAVERRGSYSRVGVEMQELKSWIDSKGVEQAGYPFCLYYDNPSETPEAELRSEACIPVRRQFQPEGEVKMKELGEVQVAETRHPGPPEEFGRTYGPFLEGLLKAGYSLVGPAREYYTSVMDVRGPGSGFLIQQPVAKRV
ncbi:MAG: GyrI-like domain-containing protein [Nitrososphaerota archaeon]|nr:GyrI-like domain-containing protein [Nitrososphaerota archaeon]